VGVRAPTAALPEQFHLGRALAREHRLDLRGDVDDLGAGHFTEFRADVTEDPGVAVVVGRDRPTQAEVGGDAGQNPHRVLETGVLRVGLDALEVRFGPCAFELELGDEDYVIAFRVLEIHGRTLGRQEPESGEVGDVGRVTNHVARGAERPYVFAQKCATVCMLGGRDRVSHFVPPSLSSA
jgi:hypothetical protein